MILLVFLVLAGCKVSDLTPERINAITSSVQSIGKAARPMGDDEEYYVGRAVAARITSTYPLYRNARLTEYLNLIGQTIALHTDKPTTFGGYHFALLDSSEVNAFACPGGIILITRGMLSSVKSEDELAAVLAHEIAHIIHRDGIAAIQSSRWSEALMVIGSNAAREFGPKDTASLSRSLKVPSMMSSRRWWSTATAGSRKRMPMRPRWATWLPQAMIPRP